MIAIIIWWKLSKHFITKKICSFDFPSQAYRSETKNNFPSIFWKPSLLIALVYDISVTSTFPVYVDFGQRAYVFKSNMCVKVNLMFHDKLQMNNHDNNHGIVMGKIVFWKYPREENFIFCVKTKKKFWWLKTIFFKRKKFQGE